MLRRTPAPAVEKVLDEWRKMVFVSGPRQVGKTTLARTLLRSHPGVYANCDVLTDRRKIARNPYFFEQEPLEHTGRPLLVFDELHKYARWKSYLKGVYDAFSERYAVLVTGSARLDVYKRGGDSLLGRYVPLTLFPLTLGELRGEGSTYRAFSDALDELAPDSKASQSTLNQLERLGGFPEPFTRGSDAYHRVWRAGHTERLVREDIRDATNLKDLSSLEVLLHLLEPRIGSPLSINALREDVGVAFETARAWLEVLSAFYYCFRISPWSKRVARALRKETKLYLWDWSDLDSEAARFENLVALHLLKAVRSWTEQGEASLTLHYVRDKEKREVDFLIADRQRPVLLVECKLTDSALSPHLLRFQHELEVPHAIQLVRATGHRRRTRVGGRTQWVVSADAWLPKLP